MARDKPLYDGHGRQAGASHNGKRMRERRRRRRARRSDKLTTERVNKIGNIDLEAQHE